MGKFNIQEKAQLWDATYAFPRPANEQYISSYRLFLRLVKDAMEIVTSLVLSLLSSLIAFYTWNYLLETFKLTYLADLGLLISGGLTVLLIFIWGMFAVDIYKTCVPYRSELQRESHGGRRWAKVPDLEKTDVDAIRENGADIEGKGIILAPFKHYLSLVGQSEPKYNIFLSVKRMAQAMIIYGPPGSGKSSTFFMPVIRQFASCGGAIVLDVKGELFNFTAHYFSNVFRLDIQNPFYSDWFDLFSACYRNPDLANRIAVYMVGYDPNKATNKEPIWDQSAVSMLAVIILYLCEKMKYPTPRDILRFLAENPKASTRQKRDENNQPMFDGNGNPKYESYSPLNEAFEVCSYSFVREIWGANFAQMPKDTFGSVKFNADTAIKQLLSPKVNEILRPPTEGERKKGRRRIDFTHLRQMFEYDKSGAKRGSALYIVVSPSDAMNMDVFLRVIFSVALDTLRESAKEGTPVLVALDEAGNVPLSKLPEGINTDRSKGICYFLGYQDRNQPVAQYGREAAATFLGTAGVNIFLPGVDDDTAKLASERLGETTILQRSSSDARNDGYDNEKLAEHGRKLMLPQELTEMKWFTQCVITIKGASPIRTKIPPDAKMMDTRISEPQRVVEFVSEEVMRMLGLKKGREVKQFQPSKVNHNLYVPQQVKLLSNGDQKAEKSDRIEDKDNNPLDQEIEEKTVESKGKIFEASSELDYIDAELEDEPLFVREEEKDKHFATEGNRL